jgi:hypothetical protein
MPWKRARTLPPPDNTLFEACFRIQRECSKALGRHVPMVVENVCGAQKWLGRAKWHYGSYYLWGDVPALMPSAIAVKVSGLNWSGSDKPGYVARAFNTTAERGLKVAGFRFDGSGRSFQTAAVKDTFGWPKDSPVRNNNSHSPARKEASALIAMIPRPLAEWIGKVYLPPDPRFEPTPESPAWLAALGEADQEAERWLEEREPHDPQILEVLECAAAMEHER